MEFRVAEILELLVTLAFVIGWHGPSYFGVIFLPDCILLKSVSQRGGENGQQNLQWEEGWPHNCNFLQNEIFQFFYKLEISLTIE